MEAQEMQAYAFGTVFLLANKIQRLGDQRDPRLTVKQWMFLAGVVGCQSQPPTLSQVAGCIGSSRQNVKKTAALLEKQGFVSLAKDADDARALRIALTQECLAYLGQREDMERRFLEELFQGFSQEEMGALCQGLAKLERNVNGMDGQNREEE